MHACIHLRWAPCPMCSQHELVLQGIAREQGANTNKGQSKLQQPLTGMVLSKKGVIQVRQLYKPSAVIHAC